MKQCIWCRPMQMQHFKHHRGSSEALHQSRHCEIMWEDITEETNSLKVTSHNRIKHRRTLFLCVRKCQVLFFFVWRCFSLKFQPPDCHSWGEQRWILCFALKWTRLLDIPSTCGFIGTIPSVKSSANKKKCPSRGLGLSRACGTFSDIWLLVCLFFQTCCKEF